MSLLTFWATNVSVVLLSIQGQKALGFHQKYCNMCSKKEEWRSNGFGTTWGWVTNYWQIFGWTRSIPLMMLDQNHVVEFHFPRKCKKSGYFCNSVWCSNYKPPFYVNQIKLRVALYPNHIWCINSVKLSVVRVNTFNQEKHVGCKILPVTELISTLKSTWVFSTYKYHRRWWWWWWW